MSRKTGFTLIELLVVIAIIALLAAIIFPVYMRAKDASYRAGDMSNMNSIRNALQLYRADQEAYPPQILGYATYYDPGMTQLVPADQLHAALYPKRIGIKTVQPAYDYNKVTDLTHAVWPPADPRTTPNAPIKDLNGDGVINSLDDLAPARQQYGPTCGSGDCYFCTSGASCSQFATNDPNSAAQLYKVSGFDAGEVKVPGSPNSKRWELRYTLRWTSYAMGGGNRQDDPRQLIYSDPPDDTVVTWDSWFRNYDGNGNPTHDKREIVLFLGGGARPFDSALVNDRSWRLLP